VCLAASGGMALQRGGVHPGSSADLAVRMSGVLGRSALLAAILPIALATGCARFGFSDRLLHRIPSPDGQTVAVCQEIPEFDGPSFDVRLERRDGTRRRDLFHMGDGDGCSEMAWSIGVQDRHHENWGVIVHRDVDAPSPRFAPLYDSARGLFCNENDRQLKDCFHPANGSQRIAGFIGRSRPLVPMDLPVR
jgi:hypothetical protein